MLQEWKCPVCLEQKHGGPCNRENQIVAAPKSAAPTFDPKGAAYASGDLFWDEKYVEVRDILKRLRYIAESPSKEHGGFHEQAIQTARDAIAAIEKAYEQGRTDRECETNGSAAYRDGSQRRSPVTDATNRENANG